jgi:hypothetical protein
LCAGDAGVELRTSSEAGPEQDLAYAGESLAGSSYGREQAIDSGELLESQKNVVSAESDFKRSPVRDWLYAALLAVVVARLWIVPLRDGFWIDETGTLWSIQGGFRNILARCALWPAQSPAYSFVAWLMYKIKGPNEFLIRLPSLVAMALATYLLYRLAIRLIGWPAAWPSIILFASFGAVAFAAGDARPYAIATLAAAGAILFLVRWLDTGRWLGGLCYCILASLSVYMHFLFATTFLVHLVYGVYRSRNEKRVSVAQLCLAAATIGLLLVPFVFHMLALMKTAHSHSFAGTPTGIDFFTLLAPPAVVGSVLGALLLLFLAKRPWSLARVYLENSSLVLLASWALIPMSVLYTASVFTSLKVFLPRYTLPSEAGLALLGGWLLSSISPPKMRAVAVSAMVLAIVVSAPSASFSHGGDWRAAMASVRSTVGTSDMPVLVRADFPESEPFDWLQDEARKSYLFAPLGVYPAAGEIVPLPMHPNEASSSYLNELVPRLERSNRFLLVNMGDPGYQNWLLGRLSPDGFVRRRVGSFGGSLSVDMYLRSSETRRLQQ